MLIRIALGVLLALASVTVARAQDIDAGADLLSDDPPSEETRISEETPYKRRCLDLAYYSDSTIGLIAECHDRSIDADAIKNAGSAYKQAAARYFQTKKALELNAAEVAKGRDGGASTFRPDQSALVAAIPLGCRPDSNAAVLPEAGDAGASQVPTSQMVAKAKDELESALRSFERAVDRVQHGTPKDFEKMWSGRKEEASDSADAGTGTERWTACMSLRKKRVELLKAERQSERINQTAAEESAAPASAFDSDVLRKATQAPSVSSGLSQIIENPGTPEYVTYSVLSALGADKEVNGTQIQLTLNLSSLFTSSEDRRKMSGAKAVMRNLFVRGLFPLETTKTASAPGQESSDPTSVRRFSVMIGGSLLDDSDPRLANYKECYQAALGYAPFSLDENTDRSTSEARSVYYDACNRAAANAQRLAWRGAVGLATPTDGSGNTKAEIYAATIVYAPISQIYINALYQGLMRPDRVHSYGVAVSSAGNVGGDYSGSSAWARLGLDLTFLASYHKDDGKTSWEVRIAPTIRGRLLSDGVATVALGPRILSNGDTQLLATIAFGYDSDRVINQLLTPVATKP